MWPPAWTIGGIAGLLAAGGLALRNRGRRHAIVLAAAAGVAATLGTTVLLSRPDGLLHVSVLDAGSATAVVVRSGDGGVALIDGGPSSQALLQALGRVLPPTTHRIDLLVITGSESSAVAGLAGLTGHYQVATAITPANMTPGAQSVIATLQASGTDVITETGGTWRWGGASWRCLPFAAAATGRSMCALRIDDPTGRVLVLGNAGTGEQDELSAAYGPALAADVVVTPPGGAVSRTLLATARPSQLAVPVAKGAHATVAPAGYAISRTGADGDLEYVGGPAGLERT
jgi:beta-lactamase superfamily II metal-dependent hydrolase